MFFAKDEVIELENKKNYLILNTTILDNEIFYQIGEINESGTDLTGEKMIIFAINNKGNLYIEDLVDKSKLAKLTKIFAS